MREDEVCTASPLEAPRLLHSDPHDFAGLYIRHRATFTLHARHYLRDARDADEVVQEAFLRLFLALPELDTEMQALAYCRRTITNLCIDRYREQARRPHLVDIASVPLEEFADEEDADPVVRAEDAALVREALSMLSPLHRAALVKREIEEKPLPVIAEELDVPEDSVKHLLFRARRALRRLLVGTSLAPGTDSGEGVSLGATLRAGSGGLAAFLVLLVLGLGSGPNLKAIPVVGVDLPDIIDVTGLARSVGSAVDQVVAKVSPAAPGGGSGARAGDAPAAGSRTGVDGSGGASEWFLEDGEVSSAPPGPPRSLTVSPTPSAPAADPAPTAPAGSPSAPSTSTPPAPATDVPSPVGSGPTAPATGTQPLPDPTGEAPTTGPLPDDGASSPAPEPGGAPSIPAPSDPPVDAPVPPVLEPPVLGNVVEGGTDQPATDPAPSAPGAGEGGHTGGTGQPDGAGQPEGTGQSGQSGQSGGAGQAGEAGEAGQAVGAGQAGQAGDARGPAEAGQADRSAGADEADASDSTSAVAAGPAAAGDPAQTSVVQQVAAVGQAAAAASTWGTAHAAQAAGLADAGQSA